jgi:hypothetical protein
MIHNPAQTGRIIIAELMIMKRGNFLSVAKPKPIIHHEDTKTPKTNIKCDCSGRLREDYSAMEGRRPRRPQNDKKLMP